MTARNLHLPSNLPAPGTVLGGLTVSVHQDLEPVIPLWRELERTEIATFYQTHAWCSAWINAVQQEIDVAPVIVIARWQDGRPAFLLPLQRRVKKGISAIEFMTAPIAGYGYGIYTEAFLEQAVNWFRENFRTLQSLLPLHDALYLREMPQTFENRPHPLTALFTLRSANQCHLMKLGTDFDNLMEAKRSAETRRSMRKRDAKLAAMGALAFGELTNEEAAHATLEQMFLDQRQRLGEAGVHNVYTPVERQFVHDLLRHCSNDDGQVSFSLHSLTLDGTLLCGAAGGIYRKTFWSLVLSLAEGPARKHSPGDYALRGLMRSLCSKGLTTLDFSAGDTAYKMHWVDESIQLFHVILPGRGLRGALVSWGLKAKHWLKREIKSNTKLRTALFAFRRMALGNKKSHQ